MSGTGRLFARFKGDDWSILHQSVIDALFEAVDRPAAAYTGNYPLVIPSLLPGAFLVSLAGIFRVENLWRRQNPSGHLHAVGR